MKVAIVYQNLIDIYGVILAKRGYAALESAETASEKTCVPSNQVVPLLPDIAGTSTSREQIRALRKANVH